MDVRPDNTRVNTKFRDPQEEMEGEEEDVVVEEEEVEVEEEEVGGEENVVPMDVDHEGEDMEVPMEIP